MLDGIMYYQVASCTLRSVQCKDEVHSLDTVVGC